MSTSTSGPHNVLEPLEQSKSDLGLVPDPLVPLELVSLGKIEQMPMVEDIRRSLIILDSGDIRWFSSIIQLENLMTKVNAEQKQPDLRPENHDRWLWCLWGASGSFRGQ